MKMIFLVIFLTQCSSVVPVVSVYDGDSFTVGVEGEKVKIRVLGIDCPEKSFNAKCRRDEKEGRPGCEDQVPFGKIVANRAKELLVGNVTLECDDECKTDLYGRELRYVKLQDGRDYGLVLIREGYCQDYSWKYPHPRQKQYLEAQEKLNNGEVW